MSKRIGDPLCFTCGYRQISFTEIRPEGQFVVFQTDFSGKINPRGVDRYQQPGASEVSLKVTVNCPNCGNTWTLKGIKAVKELPNFPST